MASGPHSYTHLENLPHLEVLYQQFQRDPGSVEESWRHFFAGMELGGQVSMRGGDAERRLFQLITAYRTHGHLLARVNPLEEGAPEEPDLLRLEAFGFSQTDLQKRFPTDGLLEEPEAPLSAIVEALKQTYCGSVGVEYMGLGNPAMERWLQERIEPGFSSRLSREEQLATLSQLNQAELFESFIHTKYVGHKRFSLEGSEAMIPLLLALFAEGSALGVQAVELGMSHRGRLNLLANVLGKPYAQIFHEFEEFYMPDLTEGTGDVKYHKGYKALLQMPSGALAVALSANPSHLESVGPVVEGYARALQEQRGGREQRKAVLPLLIHGDAALAGQGVVYETLQLSQLTGYATGGTIHIAVNNQIGFTTLPQDGRSTRYCTDIAKAFGAPVFHVNGEDPEMCVKVAKLAVALRQEFQCDLFIDLVSYRKYGHNEGDEPLFTQPREYQKIKGKHSVRQLYAEQLIGEGVLTRDAAGALEREFKQAMQSALDTIPRGARTQEKKGVCPPLSDLFAPCATALPKEELVQMARQFCSPPEGLTLHPKIQRLLKERRAMVEGDPEQGRIDWGMGEHLAYASLAAEGMHVRISGQDARRGTFTHRHAVWVDQVTHERYYPLSHLREGQGLFDVYNSPLSEMAVLGFEFGYSLAWERALVVWEAQFGDFANSAQVIIDQYIAASEQKWGVTSNLVLLLPHGYEGQGPEHSSARIERYLQMAAEENLQIACCTTPAQLFHLLRRQALRSVRKPLILFTPKALLRHPETVSALRAFTKGSFREILDDPAPPAQPRKLLLCCGKVFYDLLEERSKRPELPVVVVRLEQLYPLHEQQLVEIVHRYPDVEEIVWVQEEHRNMGAWEFLAPHLMRLFGRVRYAGRGRSASPAAGSKALHMQQYAALMDAVFKENG